MSYPNWLKALARSNLVKTLGNLVEEFVVACFVLLGAALVHGLLLRTPASDSFRELFTAIHHGTALATYTVVGVRSVLQVGFRELKL
jgi:hypothetical protein